MSLPIRRGPELDGRVGSVDFAEGRISLPVPVTAKIMKALQRSACVVMHRGNREIDLSKGGMMHFDFDPHIIADCECRASIRISGRSFPAIPPQALGLVGIDRHKPGAMVVVLCKYFHKFDMNQVVFFVEAFYLRQSALRGCGCGHGAGAGRHLIRLRMGRFDKHHESSPTDTRYLMALLKKGGNHVRRKIEHRGW